MNNIWWICSVAFAPLTRRPWRFFIYIVIFYLLGVAIFTFQNFVTGLQLMQTQSTAELLGGDVEIDIGYREFDELELNYLADRSSAQTEIVSLRSMLQKEDGEAPLIRLSNLRVVDDAYPLMGEVEFGDDVQIPALQALLANSEGHYGILLSNELTEFFSAKIGDIIQLLDGEFIYRGTIESTPEVAGSYNILLPSAMISAEALTSLNVTTETMLLSHQRYLLLPPNTDIDTFRGQALLDFHDRGWQVTTRDDYAQSQSDYITMATRVAGFINLVVTISLIVALYTTLRTHLLEERATAQSMSEMGARASQIAIIYGTRLLTILGIAMIFTLITMWALSHYGESIGGEFIGILNLPSDVFKNNAVQSGLLLTLIGVATGVFAYWFNFARRNFWIFLISIGLVAWLIWKLISQYRFNTEMLLVVGAFATAILGFWFFIRIVKAMLRRSTKPNSIFGISLLEYAGKHSAQENFGTLIFANLLIIAGFASILISIQDISDRFSETPKPSHYIADLQDDQIENYEKTISQFGASEISLYPVVRARVTALNGELPSSDHWLFKGDRLIGADQNNQYELAIHGDGMVDIAFSAHVAKELGLEMGDTLTISVLGQDVTLNITALRERDLGSGLVEFTMILPQQAVDEMPHIFLSSITLTKDQRPVLNSLVEQFPNAIIVSTDRALERFQSWLNTLTHALWLLGAHILSASIIALFCVASLIMRKERYDQSIFSMIGMRRRDLRRLQINKVIINGLLASAVSFGLVWIFVKYGFEPILGMQFEVDLDRIALITVVSGLLCSSVPVLLMLIGASNPRRIDEFAQDYQKLVLDF